MKKVNNKWLDFKVFSVKIIYLVITVIAFLIFAIIKPETLYFDFTVIAIILVACIYFCVNEINNRKDRINELSEGLESALKNNLNMIDIPMAIVKNSVQILWQNNVSKHLIQKEYIIDTSLKMEKQKRQNESMTVTSDIGNGEVYTAIGSSISFSNFDCLLITYINKTNEEKLKKSLEDTKVAVGIVFVDNYEETMQGLDEIKKAEISSKITKELGDWVSEYNGVLNKIEKDKYIVFIEKRHVNQMEISSFQILERVRKITDETKLPITVSVGMSYSEPNLDERYSASASALDIALGRGGDQVVLKKDKKFDFFGGSSLELEKTSRVRARTIAHALKEVMEKSEKIYIMGHKNTDIDCIGASVGVYKIAKSLGKKAQIITDTKCNSSTKIVINNVCKTADYEDIFVTKDDVKKHDFANSLLVIVDTHKKSYLPYPEIVDEIEKVVIIDHHRRGPEFIDNALLTYHEIYASSASELVTELLMYLENVELTPAEAESLYAGIVVDTKNFLFKTGVRTFEVAAYLKKYGIDLSEVKQLFQNDFETYVAKVDIVKNAEIIRGQIAVSICEDKHDEMPIIAAQAADELLSISGILASFVLCKVDEIVMISGRSMGDINVQAILETIGGGGHLTFAGAQIAGITLEEARVKLLESIDEYYGKE